jgi:hypothetical protein
MWRRLTLILTLAALAGVFLILLDPVNIKVLQVAFLGCLVVIPVPVCASGTLPGCAPDCTGSVRRIR